MNRITNAYLLFTLTSARIIIRSNLTDNWPGLNVLIIKIVSLTNVSFFSKTIIGKTMKKTRKLDHQDSYTTHSKLASQVIRLDILQIQSGLPLVIRTYNSNSRVNIVIQIFRDTTPNSTIKRLY